jgi:transcription antitermination factor NusG
MGSQSLLTSSLSDRWQSHSPVEVRCHPGNAEPFWRITNWFAIHAKKQRESLAAANLQRRGIEVFFPEATVEPASGNGAAVRPLFPGYFFSRFRPEESLGLVESSHGVLQVLRSGRCPIPIEDGVIQEIQSRAREDGLIRIGVQGLTLGRRVLIQGGPFEGMLGKVQAEMDDQRRVSILLEALWHSRVLIAREWLQVADA